jgi:hypothetical protein
MKAMADPETIAAIIEGRSDKVQPRRMPILVGKSLSPSELVSELVELHNYLNTQGPTEEWDLVRQWLFNYVDMYKSQIAMEDDAPELAFRTPFIKASEQFTEVERCSIAEAQSVKKQVSMQKRALAARNIWW